MKILKGLKATLATDDGKPLAHVSDHQVSFEPGTSFLIDDELDELIAAIKEVRTGFKLAWRPGE